MKTRKLFVYGTLQRGMHNSLFLPDEVIEWVKDATIKGDLYMVKRAYYPAMILDKTENIVHGELVSVKSEFIDEVIKNCDHLEGHPTFYKRTLVEVTDKDGNSHAAYTYEFMQPQYLGKKIQNGKFRDEYRKLNLRK